MGAVAVDIDGVLANFAKAFSALVHDLDPSIPIIEGPNYPIWDNHLWWGDPTEERSMIVEEAWRRIKTDSNLGFWWNPEPIGDLSKLEEIYRRLPIVFMTRRDGNNAWWDTLVWLRAKGGIAEPLLYRVHPGEEKHELCAKLGISVIIDDSPKVVEQCLKAGMKVIMPAYEYNSHVPDHPRLYRVFSLDAALSVAEIQSEYRAKPVWPDMFIEMKSERKRPADWQDRLYRTEDK